MNDLDENYFQTKMDKMLDEVKTTLKSKTLKLGKETNFRTKNFGLESGMLKSAKPSKGNEIKNEKLNLIKERIERLENNQKKFENMFKINVDNFLKEFKNEIEKITGNQKF